LRAVSCIKRPYAINQTGQTAKLAFHQFDWTTQQQAMAIETLNLMIIKMVANLWLRNHRIAAASGSAPFGSAADSKDVTTIPLIFLRGTVAVT